LQAARGGFPSELTKCNNREPGLTGLFYLIALSSVVCFVYKSIAPVFLLDAFLPHLKPSCGRAKNPCVICSTRAFTRASERMAGGSYPLKGVPKNIASLITYPHSGSKHLENEVSPAGT
jgi:hypothetical protein